MTGEVGVPRVGVDDVGADGPARDRHVDSQGLQSGIGGAELGQVGISGRAGLAPFCAETADLDIDVTAGPQGPDQLGAMHPRAPVDGRWVLLAEDVYAHARRVASGPQAPRADPV